MDSPLAQPVLSISKTCEVFEVAVMLPGLQSHNCPIHNLSRPQNPAWDMGYIKYQGGAH